VTLRTYLDCREKEFLISLLEKHHWCMTETARAAGISRKNLWQKMRKHRIRKPGPGTVSTGQEKPDSTP
jgi:transcriptional regulator of acetoin/glycerol metabolism